MTLSAEKHFQAIVSAPFEENTYIASMPGREDCLVIDPGLEPDKIVASLKSRRLHLRPS